MGNYERHTDLIINDLVSIALASIHENVFICVYLPININNSKTVTTVYDRTCYKPSKVSKILLFILRNTLLRAEFF